jgi:hypothetical protein
MAVITSGKTFANGEQLSADKLNQVITAATFNQADAVDGSTMTLIGGAMAVADSGITKAKIENVANMKALGNTSGSAAAPQEVAILDEDTMSSDSATSLATQRSIKAFVETSKTSSFTPTTYNGGESVTLPNGLTMKMGKLTSVEFDQTFHDVNYGSAFGTAVISVQTTIHASGIITGTRATVVKDSSTSGFKVAVDYDTNTSSGDINWFAIGH